MAVLQPLYFPGGRYSAGTDRKLLAALIPSETDGTRVSGVIPSYYGTKSMKVSANGVDRDIAIQPGICVIPDLVTQSADSPGFYLASIDSSSETVTLAVNSSGSARVDTIYAVVDDTPYTIITKSLTGNVATITTSAAHGFAVGQTVVINGVDNVFDGTYVIASVPTTTTFTYAKTHADVGSTNVRAVAYSANQSTQSTQTYDGTVLSATITNKALTSNIATLTTSSAHGFDNGSLVTIKGVDALFDGTYQVIAAPTTTTFNYVKIADNVTSTSVASSYSTSAIARVPFAIKAEQAGGTTLSTKTKIKLATVSVPGNNAAAIPTANVTDYRQYVTGLGGVHLYDTQSSGVGPTGSDGRLRWTTNSTGPTGGTRKLEVYDGASSSWYSLYDRTSNNHDDEATDSSTTAIHHTLGTGANQAAAGNHTHYSTDPSGFYDADVSTISITSTSSSSPNQLYYTTYNPGRTTDVLIIVHVMLQVSTTNNTQTGYIGYTINGASTSAAMGTSDAGGTFTLTTSGITTLNAGTNAIRIVGYRSGTSWTGSSIKTIISIVPIK